MTQTQTFGALRGPLVDQSGNPSRDFLKKMQEWESKLSAAITLFGTIASTAKIQGRTEGIGTTVGNVNSAGKLLTPGVGFTVDGVPDGATFARTVATALTANQVDLSKTGVIGPLGSAKINQNVMNNYSNNAMVDSIDNGVNATIRVYGPGGPGTTWHQFIGSAIGPEIASFSGTAPYSVDRNVYFDGTSYFISANGSDTLPDGIRFSGSLHTVAAGGGGGAPGGGGAGGGSGGSARK